MKFRWIFADNDLPLRLEGSSDKWWRGDARTIGTYFKWRRATSFDGSVNQIDLFALVETVPGDFPFAVHFLEDPKFPVDLWYGPASFFEIPRSR